MDNILITKEDIYTVAQVSRLTPFITKKASDTSEIGKIFGLGVAGFIGSVIEIEAIAFKAHEKVKVSCVLIKQLALWLKTLSSMLLLLCANSQMKISMIMIFTSI